MSRSKGPTTTSLPDPEAPASVVRLEEELLVEAEPYTAGSVRVRKRVEPFAVAELHDRNVEFGDVYEGTPEPDDDGRIVELEDGSVSVPLFEEQIVVEKRRVLRERVVIRKAVVSEHTRVSGERAVERVEVEEE